MDELVSNRRDVPEPLLQSLRQPVLHAGDSFMKTLAYSPIIDFQFPFQTLG